MAKSAVVVRRAAPTVAKSKYEGLVKARATAAKKAKEEASQRAGLLAGVAACGLVGHLEKEGKMPTMGGVEPTAVLGLALGFVVPMVVKGRAGQLAAEAGAALSGVAAYKIGLGHDLYAKAG